jgi:hypothetical protein
MFFGRRVTYDLLILSKLVWPAWKAWRRSLRVFLLIATHLCRN